ncbi:Intermembrane phospholipid transport system binding protein MlaC [Myxococcaceae bacterium]|jgi:phospholipid transport system substrate-binding protein|nr:Intermembrane phospholipid transport system binding protein MlaC [Myxococcaceae bacterium]
MTISTASFRGTRAGLVFALLLASLAAVAQADEGSAEARAVVASTSEQVLEILRRKESPTDQRLGELQQIAYQRFDFPTIGRLVLARGWGQLSPAQQAEFLDDFKRHLSLDYGRRIDAYTDQKVEVLSDRSEANGDATVRTQVHGANSGLVAVDYRLRKVDGQWRVIDVIVEGVSLVSSYRSQFQEIMSSGGPTRVLQVLREKNSRAPISASAG